MSVPKPTGPARPSASELIGPIFDQNPLGLLVLSTGGTILKANWAAARIQGRTPESMVGLSLLEVTQPEDAARNARLYEDLGEGRRERFVLEKRYPRPDGTTFWGRLTISAVRFPDRSIDCFICAIEDIDDFKRASALARKDLAVSGAIQAHQLEQSQGQARTFRALYQVALAATGVLDPIALATLAIDTAAELLHAESAVLVWWDPEAELLRPLADSSPSPARGQAIRSGQGATGRAFAAAAPVILRPADDPDPELAAVRGPDWGLLAAVPAVVGDRTVGALGVRFGPGRELSNGELDLLSLVASLVAPALEAARLHSALSESELRQSAIVEAALDCIIATDAGGTIVEFNPAAERTFGYAAHQVLGHPISDLVHGPEAPLLAEEGPLPLVGIRNETRGVRADGATFPIELVVTGLGDSPNPLVLISIRDLTPIYLAEVARQESEAKSRFLATMSHELRTPLNSVLGFTQLLSTEQFGALNEKQRRYLDNISRSGLHLLGLINDVLDLAKVQAGEIDLSIELFKAKEVIDSTIEQMLPQARAKQIRLGAAADSEIVIQGDRRRVFQILLNLVSNAIKFTPELGSVDISTAVEAGLVRICVTDTGLGIESDQLGRIFEEFTQLESGTTRNQQGTGLGLALSRRLAEVMGGNLAVQSKRGEGSVFILELPAARPTA